MKQRLNHIKQRNRLLKRKGRVVELTKNCEGMLMRLKINLGFSSNKWLFTVQNGNVFIFMEDHWTAAPHNHWLLIVNEFVIVDTNFKG